MKFEKFDVCHHEAGCLACNTFYSYASRNVVSNETPAGSFWLCKIDGSNHERYHDAFEHALLLVVHSVKSH